MPLRCGLLCHWLHELCGGFARQLCEVVGKCGEGPGTLWDDWSYIANYEESMEILEYLFPKDKYIFLMCGAWGYANFTKKMLIALWRDESKIYNVWWYRNYEWEKWISTINNNWWNISYDFWKVPYHNIDFDALTLIDND